MKIINPYRFAAGGAALLLDETGLGSAHAAYSLARKLRDAYTGSAFRVRRTSDNAEQDIGFSGDDLDQSSLTTFCSGTDGYIKTLYDQSGNGNDATQTTAGNQSQIVSSGSVLTDNGKPAMSNGSLTRYVYAGGAVTEAAVSLMSVHNTGPADGTNSLKCQFGVGRSTETVGGFNLGFGTYNVAADRRKPGLIIDDGGSVVSAAANAAQLLAVGIINGTDVSFYENNETEVTDTLASTLNLALSSVVVGVYLSNNLIFPATDGSWQEGVVWLSDVDAYVGTIKSNVNTFYSIY